MDSSITFYTLTIFMLLIASLNIAIPLMIKKDHSTTCLIAMVIISLFFLGFIVMLGTLYVENGVTSFSIISFRGFVLRFHLESLGIIFLSLVGSLWPIAIIYTYSYLKESNHPYPKVILSFISLNIVITTMLAISANLITMFIFYELLTLLTIPLVFNGSFEDLEKYIKPLIYPSLLLFLPAILISLDLSDSSEFKLNGLVDLDPVLATILLLLFVFGIAKAALVPVHKWLLSAMVAISPVSALLHAVVVVKAGIFCIVKIIVYVFGLKALGQILGSNNILFLSIAGITIIYSGIMALKKDDLKEILAFSTINQLATSLLGIFLFSMPGLSAALMQMVAHSAAKITAFFVAGNIYLFCKDYNLKSLSGSFYRMPITITILIFSLLSLCGMPFLAGYVSKSFLITAILESNNYLAVMIFLIGTILTFSYCGRVIYFLFKKPVYKQKKIEEKKELIIPLLLAATTIIIFPFTSFIIEKLIYFIQI